MLRCACALGKFVWGGESFVDSASQVHLALEGGEGATDVACAAERLAWECAVCECESGRVYPE